MKLPKATKLKSGNWRIQIQIDGHRYSCTGTTKKEAQEKAKQKYAGIQAEKRILLTVGVAIDKYIEQKSGVLSPSTIKGYRSYRNNYFQRIMKTNISDLTKGDIQVAVSSEAIAGKSPKTIKNAYGLLTATLREFRPDFVVNTKLPQKQPKEERILTEEEIMRVWKASEGSKYELPILLASWLGLRVSEVRGLQFGDIQNGRIHIQRAIIQDENKQDVVKGTKTASSNRWIKLPKPIADLIDKKAKAHPKYGTKDISTEFICPMTRSSIYEGFIRRCKKAGVEPCTFHDLRHWAASEAHSLGVPNKYLEKRMGHSTDNMLKTVYEHAMADKEEAFNDLIDQKMEKLFETAHKTSHEN